MTHTHHGDGTWLPLLLIVLFVGFLALVGWWTGTRRWL